jgi:hypothetical protein
MLKTHSSMMTSSSTISQPKIEKKLMDEKISKVREVVKNVSTNDVILALHNFELDVERTIHAFCEGGAQNALGDWEKTGTVKKRNNKKKNKSAKGPGSNDDRSTNGMAKEASHVASSTSSIPSAANSGFTTPKLQQQNLLNDNFNTCVVENGKQHSPPNQPPASKEPTEPPPTLTGSTYSNYLDENRTLFENEVMYARENIQRCFKEVRDALAIREQELISELSQCQQDGLAYFASRAESIKKISKIKNAKLAADLEKRNAAAKIVDLETAIATRFFYDTNSFASLIESLGQFGSVFPVKPTESIVENNKQNSVEEQRKENGNNNKNSGISTTRQAVRRSNSPSSLVSSVDSGLGGQISPVNQEKGQIAQIEENGIMLKSDSIAPAQLAEIQRNIFEKLKAKGIDPNLLNDINSNPTAVAPRRRQPPQQNTTSGKK